MVLYQTKVGPNPRRVAIYLAEKGIDVPRYEIDRSVSEQKSPHFLEMNPLGRIPILKLDDGTTITESAAIVEFFEELHPNPPMIGTSPEERARVRVLERIGNDLLVRAQLWLMHSIPYFAGRVEQNPVVAEAARPLVEQLLRGLETHLGDRYFLAGNTPTVADCTLFSFMQCCRVQFSVPVANDLPGLDGWYRRFSERPSAAY